MAKRKNSKSGRQEKKKENLYCYYMAGGEVTGRKIYDVIAEKYAEHMKHTELWEMAEIIEIETGEKNSIDIEKLELFRDEEDRQFIEDNGVKVIFGIKYDTDNKELLTSIFGKVVDSLGGFVCSDTENFMPYLIQNTAKEEKI